jgi:hypothetical protein
MLSTAEQLIQLRETFASELRQLDDLNRSLGPNLFLDMTLLEQDLEQIQHWKKSALLGHQSYYLGENGAIAQKFTELQNALDLISYTKLSKHRSTLRREAPLARAAHLGEMRAAKDNVDKARYSLQCVLQGAHRYLETKAPSASEDKIYKRMGQLLGKVNLAKEILKENVSNYHLLCRLINDPNTLENAPLSQYANTEPTSCSSLFFKLFSCLDCYSQEPEEQLLRNERRPYY